MCRCCTRQAEKGSEYCSVCIKIKCQERNAPLARSY